MESLFLILHILCGTTGLAIAVGAFLSEKRKGIHTILGNIYHWIFLVMCMSAAALSVIDWDRLWWFLPIAFFSYAFALVGFLAARFKPRDWIRLHLAGQGGSYIAMITAVLVVNFGSGSFIVWFLPTIIGTPLIIFFAREVKTGRKQIS